MKNYIVVHLYKGRNVSRFDYEADKDKALKFAKSLWNEYRDLANAQLHEIIIIEEFTREVIATFSA